MAEIPEERSPRMTLQTLTIAIAWALTLLVSSLGDIVFYELTGSIPGWLLWAKLMLLGAALLLSQIWKSLAALRPYLVMLLAITALMRLNAWLLELPAFQGWLQGQTFAVAALALQLIEMSMALLLIGLLFLLRRKKERFFLVRGDLQVQAEPIRVFGQKKPGPLWLFGTIFTTVVIIAQFFMFILPMSPTAETLRKLLPLLPLVVLLAASNGFNEEVSLRVAPISPVYEVVGKGYAIWMAALLFGSAHYIGGIPSGVVGVLITSILGWFFGKCMLDSKGFFWPWLFHSLQDLLPFTLMAMVALG
jgi:membrane protease YdiL (CAAX protease family)